MSYVVSCSRRVSLVTSLFVLTQQHGGNQRKKHSGSMMKIPCFTGLCPRCLLVKMAHMWKFCVCFTQALLNSVHADRRPAKILFSVYQAFYSLLDDAPDIFQRYKVSLSSIFSSFSVPTDAKVPVTAFDSRINGKQYKVSLNQAFTIGRCHCGHDVEIFSPDGVGVASRMHALCIPDVANKRWIIIDVGSTKGFRTSEGYQSIPPDRRPLSCTWANSIRLDFLNKCSVVISSSSS